MGRREQVAELLERQARHGSGQRPVVDGALLEAAFAEGVGGLVKGGGPRAERALASIRAKTMVTTRLTRRLVDALEHAGVHCCVLKGVAAASAAWEDPSARQSGDVDLLVRPDQLGRAERAFFDSGLVTKKTVGFCGYHYIGFLAAGPVPVPVDLHWKLSSRVPAEVSARSLIERRVWLDTPAGRLPTLCDEDAVVFLGLHAASHCLSSLSQLADLAGYGRRRNVDWVAAARIARDWRCRPAVYLAWSAARRELGAPIPDEALKAVRPGRARVASSRALLAAERAAGSKKARRKMGRAFRASLVERLWEVPLLAIEKKDSARRRRKEKREREHGSPGRSG